ncbi:MAG: hypothetical protein ACR2QC_04920 [Gammaproteobacteria bacterium]
MYNYPPLRGGGDSCFRRNGTGGEAGIAGMANSPSAKEIPAFAGMAVFYIFGYRQILYCPQRQKEPAIPAKAGISAPKARNSPRPLFSFPQNQREKTVPFLRRQESPRRRRKLSPKAVQFPAASRRRRFLPSQEWDGGAKKIEKKVENADFFAPFSDKIQFLLHSKGAFHDENHCPPPPLVTR